MKVITEAVVRSELKAHKFEQYHVPEDKILSPAAREYLQSMQIEICFEKERAASGFQKSQDGPKVPSAPSNCCTGAGAGPDVSSDGASRAKYTDYETGARYVDKPEHMTQLFGDMLVDKDHPRIVYRGKLDRLQAEVIHAQCTLIKEHASEALIEDLDDIVDVLRELMRAEVMDEAFTRETIIGLNHKELREHSHNPMKYYKIKQMLLPDRSLGLEYAVLNLIRAAIRETEVQAVSAFKERRKVSRNDIIEELNRLSSALHIMMCKCLAGQYDAT